MKIASALSTHRDPASLVAELAASIEHIEKPDLALLFVSPHHEKDCGAIVGDLIETIGARNLIGCTGESRRCTSC